ncbi:putative bifunctional diguanylate cyclase/phosphodiesterase [Candidatus Blastococcus massiliensis]|uniref:putative bifunctional diguanylate cyclase/phosphodiesterase n=1 Tax=Candidatus Blastococcus massiliensis TaxID=1470358 RepID=UPI0004B8B908|nr:bifunctional diguanylate cyclase/phosphodiesterase [Candidatus Blastococcus massiliensis]
MPEVASPRAMTQTSMVLYSLACTTGLLAMLGSGAQGSTRLAMVALSLCALAAGLASLRWGTSFPRPALHASVVAATAVAVTAVLVSPDPTTAVVVGTLISSVLIHSCYFFALPGVVAHIAMALTAVTAGLMARGDVAMLTALALAASLVGLAVVTRSLVMRASDANRDPLTELANRRGFDQAVQAAMRAGGRADAPVSTALLDLDHFKSVNDSQGHDAGDRLLRQVADTWRDALPPSTVLARHGGDEFALLLPGHSGPAALDVVLGLCALLPGVGVSGGVAEHQGGESAAQLMRRADLALYTAKAGGRGRCELDGGSAAGLAADLAVALDTGAVAVHVQSIIDLRTGEATGVEALARWTHPERGPVSPAEFVAVAEQHDLMIRLGEHVFRTACTQLAELYATTGRRLRLGVNVSGRELCDPTYSERVRAVLAETGWPATETVLEVTESVVEAESSAAVAALHELRDLGFVVAIDDFGTGYSSLSRLDTLPVDILKLDSSFVATITSSPRRATVLRSIVGMARVLGLDVVAEGVETAEQDAQLRGVGCSFGQGWLFGRPAPLPDVVELLDRPAPAPALRA